MKKESNLSNSLLGISKSYLQCTQCNFQFNIRLETFYDISVDIIQIDSIEKALKLFFSEEIIEGK